VNVSSWMRKVSATFAIKVITISRTVSLSLSMTASTSPYSTPARFVDPSLQRFISLSGFMSPGGWEQMTTIDTSFSKPSNGADHKNDNCPRDLNKSAFVLIYSIAPLRPTFITAKEVLQGRGQFIYPSSTSKTSIHQAAICAQMENLC
jgi:hypothetical protein